MKKFLSFALSLILVLGLIGCGGGGSSAAGTWREKYDLGVRYLSEGNYQEAILAFEAAIRIDPKQADLYAELAKVYIAAGDTENALAVLRRGMDVCGETAALAELLAQLTKQPDDAGQETVFTEEFVVLKGNALTGGVSNKDLPAMFAAAFDGLGAYLPVEKRHPGDFFVEDTIPFYYQGREYTYSQKSCDYRLTLPDADYRDRVVGQQLVTTGELVEIEIDLSGRDVPARDIPIGFRDISMGDDYATVAEKLGVPAGLGEYRGIEMDVGDTGITVLRASREAHLWLDGRATPEIQVLFWSGNEQGWSIVLRFTEGAEGVLLTAVICTNWGALIENSV